MGCQAKSSVVPGRNEGMQRGGVSLTVIRLSCYSKFYTHFVQINRQVNLHCKIV